MCVRILPKCLMARGNFHFHNLHSQSLRVYICVYVGHCLKYNVKEVIKVEGISCMWVYVLCAVCVGFISIFKLKQAYFHCFSLGWFTKIWCVRIFFLTHKKGLPQKHQVHQVDRIRDASSAIQRTTYTQARIDGQHTKNRHKKYGMGKAEGIKKRNWCSIHRKCPRESVHFEQMVQSVVNISTESVCVYIYATLSISCQFAWSFNFNSFQDSIILWPSAHTYRTHHRHQCGMWSGIFT